METFLHDISWVPPLRTPELTVFFNALTWLGYSTFFLIALPIGYWLWNKHMFTRLAVLIIITGVLNAFLKDLFHDPRPPFQFALDPRVGDSYGLPSGHAQVATAMWLWIAYEIKRWWAWPVAIAIAVGVCLSRLYLGVHDIEDVLAGVLIGLATVVAYRTLVSDEFRFWHDANPLLQLAVILAIQPVVWFAWPGSSGPGVSFALFGFLFGWWSGVIVERNWIRFGKPQNWIVAIVASVAAAAVLVLGYKPLEQLLLGAGLTKMAASWILSAIIGFYATALVPFLFSIGRVSRPAAP